MKRVMEVYQFESIQGKLIVRGRVYLDFKIGDKIYVKNNETNNFEQVTVVKIKGYHLEFDAVQGGDTPEITLNWKYDNFDKFDEYLYLDDSI